MTRSTLFSILVLAAIGVAVLVRHGSRTVAAAAPVIDPAPAVAAMGRLEPAGTVLRVGVPAGNDGSCVAELRVTEGQWVARGQALATMDTYAVRLSLLAEAEARVEAARARLRQTEAGAKAGDLEAARAESRRTASRVAHLRRAKIRSEALLEQGILAVQDAENARAAFEEAEQAHRRATARLASLEEVRAVDLEVRRTELAIAEAAAAVAQADLEASQVRAPRAGNVLRIQARPGEQPGIEGVLHLADVRQMQAVAEVFEGDVTRLSAGDAAEVELFSTGQRFAGRVSQIGSVVARKIVLANDPISDTDARVVEVRIDLDEPWPRSLRRLSNARVLVRIETAERRAEAGTGGRP